MMPMLPSVMLMGLTAAVEEVAGLDDDALLVIILRAAIIVHGARIMIVSAARGSGHVAVSRVWSGRLVKESNDLSWRNKSMGHEP